MGLDLKQVHETEQIKGTSEFRLVRVRPTASLAREGEPGIFIQSGGIYYEDGKPVVNPPAWFWEDCRKMTPERRQQLGVRLPEEPSISEATATSPARPASPPAKRRSATTRSRPQKRTGDKVCPDCGKAGLKNLGSHKQHCKKEAG